MPATISVFTPSHNSQFLDEAYVSLVGQDFEDWEWVVVLNGGAKWTPPVDDDRVILYEVEMPPRVGALKREAVSLCEGSILVELDHDDTLATNALSEVYSAFQAHPDASLVYSTFSQVKKDTSPDPEKFGSQYGWEYEKIDGGFLVPRVLRPTPHNVSLIWYAPNHIRAFTRKAYDQTEGYDPKLTVLDDLDIIAKLYGVGEFIVIDKPLYFQRMYAGNTQRNSDLNRNIQTNTWFHYEKNLLGILEAWSYRNDFWTVEDLNVDRYEELQRQPDNSVGYVHVLRLNEFSRPLEVIETAHQKLAPNGMLLTLTPYFGRAVFEPWIDIDEPKFQVSRMQTIREGTTPYLQANLIAIKDGYVRDGGVIG